MTRSARRDDDQVTIDEAYAAYLEALAAEHARQARGRRRDNIARDKR